MEILKAVKAIMVGDTDYQAAVTSTYIGAMPIEPVHPSVTLHLVTGTDDFTHDGPSGLEQDLIRIYSRGTSDKECSQVARAVHTLLQGYVGTVDGHAIQLIQHRNRNTSHDEQADVYRQIDDYRVHYRRVG